VRKAAAGRTGVRPGRPAVSSRPSRSWAAVVTTRGSAMSAKRQPRCVFGSVLHVLSGCYMIVQSSG
jgi:hypothetical protein